jgi:hypothetical protein
MQRLSTRCCFLLVAVSSILLRSQTLLSSARTINFAPTEPNQPAPVMTLDVQVSVFIIIASLVLPLVWLVKPFDWLYSCTVHICELCWKHLSKQSTQVYPE